jgi:hypothetical protein
MSRLPMMGLTAVSLVWIRSCSIGTGLNPDRCFDALAVRCRFTVVGRLSSSSGTSAYGCGRVFGVIEVGFGGSNGAVIGRCLIACFSSSSKTSNFSSSSSS